MELSSMPGLHPVASAVLVAVLVLLLCAGLIFTHLRRKAGQRAGIQALSELKWRDFSHLVLEALRRDGWVEDDIDRQPGDSGFDFVLSRNGERALLSCKHGRTFRLGEGMVRDLATAVRMHGASGGIIATLGSIEGFAREVAEANQIEVMDGDQLWQRVIPLMPAATLHDIDAETQRQSKRQMGIASAASLTIGAAVFMVLAGGSPDAFDAPVRSSPQPALTSTPSAPVPTPAPNRAVVPVMDDRNGDGLGIADPEPDPFGGDLRLAVASSLRSMPGLGRVEWSTRSTLVLGLAEQDTRDDVIDPLVEETCRMLVQHEELRFTRLQLEPAPGHDTPVRWRQCR